MRPAEIAPHTEGTTEVQYAISFKQIDSEHFQPAKYSLGVRQANATTTARVQNSTIVKSQFQLF